MARQVYRLTCVSECSLPGRLSGQRMRLRRRQQMHQLSRVRMTWLGELIWREFYAGHHVPFPACALGQRSALGLRDIPWRDARCSLSTTWTRRGAPAIPVVDAAMRQLTADWLDAQPGAPDRRLVLDERSAGRLAAGASAISCSTCSTATLQPITAAGSGPPAPAPTLAPYFRVFNPDATGEPGSTRGATIRAPLGARVGQLMPPEFIHTPVENACRCAAPCRLHHWQRLSCPNGRPHHG